MYALTHKAREVVDRLVTAFDEPEKFIDTITRAVLIPNTSPCMKWGPTNRFLVALHGTSDARGFRQWQESNRSVKKGAKALHILVPRFRKIEDKETEEVRQQLIGFVSAPVFAVEATEGDPLPETVPTTVPRLQVVADALDIPINYAGAPSERIYGVYCAGKDSGRITLYTHDVATFYHELVHALHHRTGKLRLPKDANAKRDNEIVAEIGAAVLVNIFEGEEVGRQAIGYIKGYAATKTRLLKLLPEIVEVVDLAIHLANSAAEPVALAVHQG